MKRSKLIIKTKLDVLSLITQKHIFVYFRALLHQPQVNYHFLQLLYMHYIIVIATITAL